MKRKNIFIWTLAICLIGSQSNALSENFTPAERQQISIPTPGLFSKSKSFTLDFTNLKNTEWSFPLPVGKSEFSPSKGLIIRTQKGDAVKAMFDGTVRLSRYLGAYGNVIVIRHTNGLETMYANNAQNLVKTGTRVKAGQTIAIVGTEGNEAKCRFEIMVNGCIINAATLLNVKSHSLRKRTFLFTDRGNAVNVSTTEETEDKELAPKELVDMDGEFSAYEQRVVSAPTPGLFDKSNSITINFTHYAGSNWSYPLVGSKVISPYGGKRRHSGVDLKTKANDDILAAFPGKVRFSGVYAGYGNVVVIRHAAGFETLYSHNSKNLVKAGDWVNAGQAIALTGRTGRATTEHCHFEIRINGKAYNPALVFDHNARQLKKVKVVAHKSGKVYTEKANTSMAEATEVVDNDLKGEL